MRELNTVDLFCGAGGASTGLELALSRLKMCHKGLAINHWAVAVDTMKRNHPDIDTKQMTIEEAVPADLVPGGEVDLLWASPSTVKPLALMRYLVRLVTRKGGIVLDPFMGSGTTGVAAIQEGMNFVGIERDPHYYEIASRRVNDAKPLPPTTTQEELPL